VKSFLRNYNVFSGVVLRYTQAGQKCSNLGLKIVNTNGNSIRKVLTDIHESDVTNSFCLRSLPHSQISLHKHEDNFNRALFLGP
jgi:hypothetical protein